MDFVRVHDPVLPAATWRDGTCHPHHQCAVRSRALLQKPATGVERLNGAANRARSPCQTKRQGETGCKRRSIPIEQPNHLGASHIENRGGVAPERPEAVLAAGSDQRQEATKRHRQQRDAATPGVRFSNQNWRGRTYFTTNRLSF